MSLTDGQIRDLATSTQEHLGWGKFQQIAQNLRDYEVMGRWLKKDKMMFDSGIGISRTVMNRFGTAGRQTGLFDQDIVNIENYLAKINIPWTRYTTNYAWERREFLENKTPTKIVSLLKARKDGMMIGAAEDLEQYAWNAPTDSSDDKTAYGVPYYVVKNAVQGFNGGNPSGFSDCAGIDSDSEPNWKNYTDTYAAVSQADLITKMRRAALKIKFKSPVDTNDFSKGPANDMRVYIGDDQYLAMQTLLREQNDDLGGDVANVGGVLTFMRHPVIDTEPLNDDSTNPVYMINHNTFYPVVLEGDYMRESEPEKAPNQHNTWVVHTDMSYNFLSVDRRKNAVLYIAP